MSRSPEACRRWKHRVSLLAADALESPAAAKARAHLESCTSCRLRWIELRVLQAGLRDLGGQLPSLAPSPALRQRWQGALAGYAVEGTESGSRRSGDGWPGWIVEWAFPGRKWWPALAGCWVLIFLLRALSPRVAAPAASTPNPPLDQVFSILQTADSRKPPAPPPPSPEGAFWLPVPKSGVWAGSRKTRPQMLSSRSSTAWSCSPSPSLTSLA